MFKAAETGATLPDGAFREVKDHLRFELVNLQQRARAAGFPIVIVISGVQGAGAIDTLNLLNTWMDPRWIHTHAADTPSDEERERPAFWRWWRRLPAAGNIALYLDGWYADAVSAHCRKQCTAAAFSAHLARITSFEETLAAEGALIVKFWLHLSKKQHGRHANKHRADAIFGFRASDDSWPQPAAYDAYVASAGRMLRTTSTGTAPWHVVAGADDNYRRATVLTILRDTVKAHIKARQKKTKQAAQDHKRALKRAANYKKKKVKASARGALAKVDLSQTITPAAYARVFRKLQDKLYDLQKAARAAGLSTIIAFEGWDAAGKGGALRRLTYAMSARNYAVIPIAAPNDEERAHHYLWRFWRHLGRAGHITIFDRTWYGRVLVERVEHLITEATWTRAYDEINAFEAQLTEGNNLVLKFWLHIDPEEQLRRFEEREEMPYKRWKITADDWRNRANWNAYEAAANDMIKHTSTRVAPWHLIAANDKRFARITILKTVIASLERALRARTAS